MSHCVGARLKNGDRTGLTRSLIKTFLMKDGLPIYASNSTIDDRTVSDEKKDRDERLQLFVWGEKDACMTDERADTVKNYNKDQAGNSVTNPVPVSDRLYCFHNSTSSTFVDQNIPDERRSAYLCK